MSHIWEDYSSIGPVYSVRSSGGLELAPDELGWVDTGNMLFFSSGEEHMLSALENKVITTAAL